jgi:ubiquinone/menaquinone biosynthesis C-methylase UbiE
MEMQDNVTKKNEELWDSRAGNYDRWFRFTRWSQRKLVSALALEGNPSLLDLACGTGWAVYYASKLMNGNGNYYGIDLSSKMIKEAEGKYSGCKNVHFRVANAGNLPFDKEFFDYVMCSNAFHHFSSPEQVVEEASRVLKPHGKLLVLDAAADSSILALLDWFMKKIEKGHVKIYSTSEFKVFFQKAGLCYVSGKSIAPAVKIQIGEKP